MILYDVIVMLYDAFVMLYDILFMIVLLLIIGLQLYYSLSVVFMDQLHVCHLIFAH